MLICCLDVQPNQCEMCHTLTALTNTFEICEMCHTLTALTITCEMCHTPAALTNTCEMCHTPAALTNTFEMCHTPAALTLLFSHRDTHTHKFVHTFCGGALLWVYLRSVSMLRCYCAVNKLFIYTRGKPTRRYSVIICVSCLSVAMCIELLSLFIYRYCIRLL